MLTSSRRANKLPGADAIPRGGGGGATPRGRRSFKSQQQQTADTVPSPIPNNAQHTDDAHTEPHATDVHTEDHYNYHVDHDIDILHHKGHYDHYDGHIANEADDKDHHEAHYDAHHFDPHDHHETEHHAPIHHEADASDGDHLHSDEHNYHQELDHFDHHDDEWEHNHNFHHSYDDKDHMDDHLGLYDMGFTATDINGHSISLDKYKGKVTLFVNVASKCGYTETNYRVLQAVYDKYKKSGLEILAFPCNDFGNQEPLHNWEIAEFARNHNVGFTMMAKIAGVNSSPIFTWLRAHSPKPVGSDQPEGAQIDWNFSKSALSVKFYDFTLLFFIELQQLFVDVLVT